MIRSQAEAQELAIDTLLEHSTPFHPLEDYEIVRAFRVDDEAFMFVALRGRDWFGAVSIVVPDTADGVADASLSHKPLNHWTSTEELDLVLSLSAAYNPTQPRHPKGTKGGGQWKKSGQGILPGTETIRAMSPDERRFRDIAETTNALANFRDIGTYGESSDTEAALAEIDRGFRARIDSVLSPHGLRVGGFGASGDPDYLAVNYKIVETDANGNDFEVGTIERNFDLSSGEVENAYFILKPHLQGRGIATDMANTLEPWYAQNGVETIRVHANIDVGGYTWAMQGFNFDDPEYDGRSLAGALLEEVMSSSTDTSLLDRLRVNAKEVGGGSSGWYGNNNLLRDEDPDKIADLLWRTAADYDLTYLADRITAERSSPDFEMTPDRISDWVSEFDGTVEYDDPEIETLLSWAMEYGGGEPPTAYELATYGMPTSKKDKNTMWPGKQIMLGSDWHGSKQAGEPPGGW